MTALALEKKIKQLFDIDIKPTYRRLVEAVPPRPIHNEKEHEKYLAVLEFCFDALEDHETPKKAKVGLAEYAKVLGLLIREYEKTRFSVPRASQSAILEFLMEQHHLTQNDLKKDLGGQSVVSSILHRKRKLNARQIEKLSKRFQISPATFFAAEE